MTASLLAQLRDAKNALEDAQIALCGAVTLHAEAKRTFELEEAKMLTEGIEGKNERERSARLRLALGPFFAALAETDDALCEARCRVEVARLDWDLARYSVRVMVPSVLQEAA